MKPLRELDSLWCWTWFYVCILGGNFWGRYGGMKTDIKEHRGILIWVLSETFSTKHNQLFKSSAQSWPAAICLHIPYYLLSLAHFLTPCHTLAHLPPLSGMSSARPIMGGLFWGTFLHISHSLHPSLILSSSLPTMFHTCHRGSVIKGCHCLLVLCRQEPVAGDCVGELPVHAFLLLSLQAVTEHSLCSV